MSFSDGLVTLRERHPDGPHPAPPTPPKSFVSCVAVAQVSLASRF